MVTVVVFQTAVVAGDSPGKSTPVEGRRQDAQTCSGVIQSVATAITFSNIQNRQHPTKLSCVPTIQVSPFAFHFILYDCHEDVLLFGSGSWTPANMVFLWAVLHHRLFLVGSPTNKIKCGLQELVAADGIIFENLSYMYGVSLDAFQADPKYLPHRYEYEFPF